MAYRSDGRLPIISVWTSAIPVAVRDWNPSDEDGPSNLFGRATRQRWSGEVPVPAISRRLLGKDARSG